MTFPSGFGRQASNPATVSTAGSVYLSAASNGYQSIAATVLGQSVYEEDATKLPVIGTTSPVTRIIKNGGGYPIGYRDYTGTLIMGIAAGGILYATLRDNSTPAGSWSVTGTNLEPGLITIDSTFSSTYASTVLAPFVALDSNTSIHFAALASGFAAFVVDNNGKVLTTPVTVDATASSTPKQAFQISSTQAICFYGSSATAQGAVVLTISGSSPSLSLAVGTPATYTTTLGSVWAGEDFVSAPKIAQLSSTLYVLGYASTTTLTAAMAIGVSGTTVTIGAPANIITASCVVGSTTTYALTATTALVLYESGAVPCTVNAVVISVSGTTCTVNTPVVATAGTSTGATPASSTLLSATKAMVVTDNGTTTCAACAITISGTTVTSGAQLVVETGIGSGQVGYTTNSATRYNPHLFPLSANTALLWYFDGSSVSRAVVLTESAGVVTKGVILYRSISAAAVLAAGFGAILPQGTSEFCSLVASTSSTNGYRSFLSTCKISGTAITQGASASPSSLVAGGPVNQSCAKLSGGKYLLHGYSTDSDSGANELTVFSSNGDTLLMAGTVCIPSIVSRTNPQFPLASVSSSRLVLIGRTPIGTTVGVSTQQLRLLNIEIAA